MNLHAAVKLQDSDFRVGISVPERQTRPGRRNEYVGAREDRDVVRAVLVIFMSAPFLHSSRGIELSIHTHLCASIGFQTLRGLWWITPPLDCPVAA